MKNNLKQKKGITLIALVITIVVLLILAGVTIAMLTGENGILGKATTAKAKSAEEEARERVNLILADWKMENAINGISLNDFLTTDEYKTNRESQNVSNVEVENENYIITVEVGKTKYEVTINNCDKKKTYIQNITEFGNRISSLVIEKDYEFEGSDKEVTIVVTAPVGDTISKIEAISNNLKIQNIENIGKNEAKAILIISTSDTIQYEYKVTTANSKEQIFINNVSKLLTKPCIEISNIQSRSFRINVTNDYPENINIEYEYYINNELKEGKTNNKFYNVIDLKAKTEYEVKVIVYYNDKSLYTKIKQITDEAKPRNDFKADSSIINYEQYKSLFDDDVSTSINAGDYYGDYDIRFNDCYNINSTSIRSSGVTYAGDLNVQVYGYTDQEYNNKVKIGEVNLKKTSDSSFTVDIPIDKGNYYGLYYYLSSGSSWICVADIYINN